MELKKINTDIQIKVYLFILRLFLYELRSCLGTDPASISAAAMVTTL
jgi:hypothetical protein